MYNEKENDESSTDEEQFEFDENQVGSSTNSQVMEDDSSPLSLLSRGKGNSFIASSSNFYKTAEVSTIAKKAAKKLSKTYSKEQLRRELSFNFDVPDKRQKVDDDNQLCDNSNTRVLSSFSAPNTPLSSPPSSPFSSPPSSPLSSPTSSPIFSFNRPRIMRSLSSMEESVQTSFLHSKNGKLLSRSQQSLLFFSEKQSSSLEEHKRLQNEENNASSSSSSSSSSSLSPPCSVSMPSLPLIPSIDRCQRISVSTLNSLLLQSRFPDDVIQSKTFLSSPLLSNPKHLISKHLIHLRDEDDDAVNNNNNIHDDDDDDDAVINNKEKNAIKDKPFIKKFKSYLIIDARYDYEYEGGHIQGAIHCPPNQIESFVHSLFPHFMDENIAIIFHCEFSSQRAPRAYSALRNLDRWLNVHLYPRVSFPDVYVLHGGYRDFFHAYPAFCSPASYVEMKDKRFKHLLREYSAEKRSLKRTRFHSFCQ